MLAAIGEESRITWEGPVAPQNAPRRLARASTYVLPSEREPYPMTVLEAMSAGAPVVTSAGTACAEVAGDAAVLVDPLDVDSIAAGLARVLGDVDLAGRLRAAGRARAATFTWSAVADAALAAYTDAAGGVR